MFTGLLIKFVIMRIDLLLMERVQIDFRHIFTSLGRHKCYQTNSVVWNKNHNLKLYILNENPYKHLRQWQFIHAIIAGYIIFAITEHSNHFVHVCVCAVWCFVTFCYWPTLSIFLQWRHNGSDGVSNHQPRDCSLKLLFGRRSRNASVIGRIYNGSVIKYWRSCTPSCSIGECAVPGLNATFCFLWFTNCVLLFDKNLILGCLWLLVFVLNILILGIWCSTIPHLPGWFCPWTFFENIGFNTVLTDPFMSHLATQLGYSAGEFQALQLIVLVAYGVVD